MSQTTEYKFTVQIDDGFGALEYTFKYPEGEYSIGDLIDAIQQGCPKLGRPDSYKFLGHRKCPPSPTPSSPSTAPAQSAAAPATQPPVAPPVELGQLSAAQLQLLDKYLLDPMYESHMTAQVALGLMSLLWKIVRPAAMKAAGTSSSEPTPKHGSWGSNA